MDIIDALQNGKVKILVKPDAVETKVIGWDADRGVFRVEVAAPAEDNKANLEVVKFFSRLVGQRVSIVRGLASKLKILQLKP